MGFDSFRPTQRNRADDAFRNFDVIEVDLNLLVWKQFEPIVEEGEQFDHLVAVEAVYEGKTKRVFLTRMLAVAVETFKDRDELEKTVALGLRGNAVVLEAVSLSVG